MVEDMGTPVGVLQSLTRRYVGPGPSVVSKVSNTSKYVLSSEQDANLRPHK